MISPEISTLLMMILFSILASFFYHPWMVHSFSATSVKAGSKTTLILEYYSSRPSRDLKSLHVKIESNCASAFVKIKSIFSVSVSLKSI